MNDERVKTGRKKQTENSNASEGKKMPKAVATRQTRKRREKEKTKTISAIKICEQFIFRSSAKRNCGDLLHC